MCVSVQARLIAAEEFHPKVLKVVKQLTALSRRSSLVDPVPVTTYCRQMEEQWWKVHDEVLIIIHNQ